MPGHGCFLRVVWCGCGVYECVLTNLTNLHSFYTVASPFHALVTALSPVSVSANSQCLCLCRETVSVLAHGDNVLIMFWRAQFSMQHAACSMRSSDCVIVLGHASPLGNMCSTCNKYTRGVAMHATSMLPSWTVHSLSTQNLLAPFSYCHSCLEHVELNERSQEAVCMYFTSPLRLPLPLHTIGGGGHMVVFLCDQG